MKRQGPSRLVSNPSSNDMHGTCSLCVLNKRKPCRGERAWANTFDSVHQQVRTSLLPPILFLRRASLSTSSSPCKDNPSSFSLMFNASDGSRRRKQYVTRKSTPYLFSLGQPLQCSRMLSTMLRVTNNRSLDWKFPALRTESLAFLTAGWLNT